MTRLEALLAAPLPHVQPSDAARVPAIILAAGAGRRLGPISIHIAKPLVPVLNVPMLYWTSARLQAAGVSSIVANVHHLADQLGLAARRLRDGGIDLELVAEPRPSGPAGGVAACRPLLPTGSEVLVVSCDAWSDLDYAALVMDHRTHGADLTIAAARVQDPSRFGVLDVNSSGQVTGLREKPADAPSGSVVSCGVYVFSARAVRALNPPEDSEYDFKDVVPMLLATEHTVRAHLFDGMWIDLGTPVSLLAANLCALGDVPVLLAEGARIGEGAVLERVVIGPGAVVGPGAKVRNCVLLPGAVVPEGESVIGEVLA